MSSPTPKPPLQSFFSHPDAGTGSYMCSGHRADIYRLRYQGHVAVAKAYKAHYATKYQSRYKTNIARFEFERNSHFYQIDALRPYCPQPFACFSSRHQSPPVFIQEYVHGLTLREFARQNSYLPRSVVEIGYAIVRIANQNRLYDLDIHASNVFVGRDELGWKPVICDFNMMPRHRAPPNPFLALSFFLKLHKANYRDYRNLRSWQRFPLR